MSTANDTFDKWPFYYEYANSSSHTTITTQLRISHSKRSKTELNQTDKARAILATKLKSLVQRRGFTIELLAELSTVSRSYIYDLLGQVKSPSLDVLVRLSVALGVETSDLVKEHTQAPK